MWEDLPTIKNSFLIYYFYLFFSNTKHQYWKEIELHWWKYRLFPFGKEELRTVGKYLQLFRVEMQLLFSTPRCKVWLRTSYYVDNMESIHICCQILIQWKQHGLNRYIKEKKNCIPFSVREYYKEGTGLFHTAIIFELISPFFSFS